MSFNRTTDLGCDLLFNIIIVGYSGVGKSAILRRFVRDSFSNEYLATIGVDFQTRTLNIDNKCCKLNIWDTSGQDRSQCIAPSYNRGVHGFIICFDLTNLESFRNINKWLEEVKRYCSEQTPVILIGTKSDLATQRTVSQETIQAYTDENHLVYLETSAKTNENMENCFVNFTRILVTHANQREMMYNSK